MKLNYKFEINGRTKIVSTISSLLFVLLFATTVLVRARCRLLRSETRSAWVKNLSPERRPWLPLLLPAVVLVASGVHATGVEQETVYTPSDLNRATATRHGNVILQGTVESIEANGSPSRFIVSDGVANVTVLFNGKLPRFFRTDWGARVEGRLRESGEVFDADKVTALNLRDHRRYVLAAYLIAMIVLLANLVSPYRCHRQARLAIARRLRREETDS